MRELIKIQQNEGKQTVSGKELYMFLEIKKDYSSWIKDQISRGMFEKGNDYTIVPLKVPTGVSFRNVDEYYFTIQSAKEISMMSMTERGQQARRYFIECEKQLQQVKDSYMIDDPIKRAQMWIEEQKERLALESKVKEDAPKVEYYNDLIDSSDLISIGDVSKVLNIDGYGRNNLFKFLRAYGVLMKNNVPYQKHVDAGHFEVKERKFIVSGENKVALTTFATQKGLEYIRKILNRG